MVINNSITQRNFLNQRLIVLIWDPLSVEPLYHKIPPEALMGLPHVGFPSPKPHPPTLFFSFYIKCMYSFL